MGRHEARGQASEVKHHFYRSKTEISLRHTFINKFFFNCRMPQDKEIEKTIRMLHPFEREILPHLSTTTHSSELIKKSTLKDIEITRALEWLENKKLISTQKTTQKIVMLGKNGEHYKLHYLPERRVLTALQKGPLSLSSIQKEAHLSTEETSAAIGVLRNINAITVTKTKEITLTLTPQGKQIKSLPEEILLNHSFPVIFDKLSPELQQVATKLQKRKDILFISEETEKIIALTTLGKEIIHHGIKNENLIGRVTPALIQTGEWKKKKFRAYDVSINVPSVTAGKKHVVTQSVDYIKRIWLDMGFKEMTGNMVSTSFWDLDTLFVPQDHPARDMQDTFYLTNPSKGSLPSFAQKIKAVHENGGKTGSKGWRSEWSMEESKRLLLRTHTTVLSAHTLATLKKADLPAKFFAVGKVFRNEAIDYSHLFEFYQVDGIVVDQNANLRHLLGYLKEFYKKMGYTDVRIRPAHFPYTEPSCEVEVFHPVKKVWLELGGAGIFRPEVVIPLLGQDIPVLAWGLGLERVITSYYNITDVRDLYKNDLAMLRKSKLWVR